MIKCPKCGSNQYTYYNKRLPYYKCAKCEATFYEKKERVKKSGKNVLLG